MTGDQQMLPLHEYELRNTTPRWISLVCERCGLALANWNQVSMEAVIRTIRDHERSAHPHPTDQAP